MSLWFANELGQCVKVRSSWGSGRGAGISLPHTTRQQRRELRQQAPGRRQACLPTHHTTPRPLSCDAVQHHC